MQNLDLKNACFELQSISGSSPKKQKNKIEPHRHNFYAIIWIRKGAGVHDIDFESFKFRDETIFLISPGQVHSLNHSPGTEGYGIFFTDEFFVTGENGNNGSFINSLFQPGPAPVLLKPTKKICQYLSDIVIKIREEYKSASDFKEEMLRSYLTIFLLKLLEISTASAPPDNHSTGVEKERFSSFLELVEINYKNHWRIADYAEKMFISGKRLNETTKKGSGKNAIRVVHDRLMLEAKRYLYHNQLNIKEIGHKLGFSDQYYFSRFFSKSEGISPQKFKGKIRKISI